MASTQAAGSGLASACQVSQSSTAFQCSAYTPSVSRASAAAKLREIGVRNGPGSTRCTRTPNGLSSARSASDAPSRANFDAL